jgi:hypothetical protein
VQDRPAKKKKTNKRKVTRKGRVFLHHAFLPYVSDQPGTWSKACVSQSMFWKELVCSDDESRERTLWYEVSLIHAIFCGRVGYIWER